MSGEKEQIIMSGEKSDSRPESRLEECKLLLLHFW